ncbi:MAG: carboxypeptidase-like regulatory domain-containing protein [Gemmatimonadales bacterium]
MTAHRTIVGAGLLFGLAASPRAAGAQELRVRVADALGNAAVGTLVSLLDQSGTEVASGIVGSLGRVRLLAGPGSYRVLLRFPGLVDTTLGPRTIAPGRIDSLMTALPGTPTPMPTVLAPLGDRCELTGVPPSLESAWSETAKMLAIVSATEAARVADLSLTSFTRRLSTSLKVEEESYNSILGPTNRPPGDAAPRWPPPDVDGLRSPAFAESHCFGLANGDGLRLGLIGLTFMPRTDSVGLAGTVWLDPSRHRTRLIEYRLAGLPKEWRPERTSGSIELHRIDPGFWVTRFWHHRTPILEADKGRERLRGFEEIGAEVMALIPTPDTTDRIAAAQLIAQREAAVRSQVARMEGVVQDTLGYPVAEAEVEVMGTEHRTASETNGRFVLEGLPVGVQMIRVRKVGYKPQYFGIRLGGGEHWEGRIAIAKEPSTWARSWWSAVTASRPGTPTPPSTTSSTTVARPRADGF